MSTRFSFVYHVFFFEYILFIFYIICCFIYLKLYFNCLTDTALSTMFFQFNFIFLYIFRLSTRHTFVYHVLFLFLFYISFIYILYYFNNIFLYCNCLPDTDLSTKFFKFYLNFFFLFNVILYLFIFVYQIQLCLPCFFFFFLFNYFISISLNIIFLDCLPDTALSTMFFYIFLLNILYFKNLIYN